MARGRRLLYVAPVPCATPLARALAAAGWQLAHVRSLRAALAELRRPRPPAVALLASEALLAGTRHELEACLHASACEWVALGAPDPARADWQAALGALAGLLPRHAAPGDVVEAVAQAAARARHAANDLDAVDDLGMVGTSAALAQLRRLVRKAAATEAPVLITGESGAGKELVAQALHACSPRAQGPFVAVNCGGLAPGLIHAELFGHERGAFTGAVSERRGLIASASGGTLFLDEVAELPLDLQATLLRVLQDKKVLRLGTSQAVPVDVRVVAATHADLAANVAAGRFREDLFYRLNVVPVAVPPLRERREDIPLLAQHFLGRYATEAPVALGAAALEALLGHPWPGNVRELANRMQRAVVMAEGRTVTPADLGLAAAPAEEGERLQDARTEAERHAITLSLERACHNVSLAARELGISRMTMYRLMAKHGLAPGKAEP